MRFPASTAPHPSTTNRDNPLLAEALGLVFVRLVIPTNRSLRRMTGHDWWFSSIHERDSSRRQSPARRRQTPQHPPTRSARRTTPRVPTRGLTCPDEYS